jgi:hypothetical protein
MINLILICRNEIHELGMEYVGIAISKLQNLTTFKFNLDN